MKKAALKSMTLEEIEVNKNIFQEHYRETYSKLAARHIGLFIDQYYFRSQLIGFEEMPQRSNPNHPLIYASNHSGMAFPWDAMLLGSKILERTGFDFKDAVRPLSAPMLSQSNLMNPYQVSNFWKKTGCVDAYFNNFETMMYYSDANVLIYPEGVPGIGKGFNRKYQLQRFSSSFILMSLKHKTDIVPVLTVNGEYINPYAYSNKYVDAFIRIVGIPFLPLGFITPLILLQPWIFYCAFPANLHFVKGDIIKPYELTNKSCEEIEYDELRHLAEEVRKTMQVNLDAAVEAYGKKAYNFKHLLKTLAIGWKYFPYTTPIGWPLLINEFDYQYQKQAHNLDNFKLNLGFLSMLRIFMRKPLLLAYYIPLFGWIPLIINGYIGHNINKKKKPAV